jgi:hypothetical protein
MEQNQLRGKAERDPQIFGTDQQLSWQTKGWYLDF